MLRASLRLEPAKGRASEPKDWFPAADRRFRSACDGGSCENRTSRAKKSNSIKSDRVVGLATGVFNTELDRAIHSGPPETMSAEWV